MRSCLLWTVMLALLVYGHSSLVLQVLGSNHHHADAASGQGLAWASESTQQPARTSVVGSLLHWFAAIRDSLHQQAHTGGLFVHKHEHSSTVVGEPLLPAAQGAAISAVPLSAGPALTAERLHAADTAAPDASHQHHHAANERHHHAVGDNSVVKSGGDATVTDALNDAAGSAAAGSAVLPLALACLHDWAPPEPAAGACPPHRTVRWTSAEQRLPERPPRG